MPGLIPILGKEQLFHTRARPDARSPPGAAALQSFQFFPERFPLIPRPRMASS